jgi:hypothetical protein
LVTDKKLYGLMAEFESPEVLLEATQKAYQQGFRKLDAYSPFPIDGLAEAMGMHHTWLSALILGGGVLGAITGFAMQYYASVISYPINAGGKPHNSWPAFIPITFELAVLFAVIVAVLGMLGLNGLPQPYHPVFNVESFTQASQDRFFLTIETDDPLFDLDETRSFLESLEPIEVAEIEP